MTSDWTSDGEDSFGSTSRFGSDEYEDDGTVHQRALYSLKRAL